MIEEPLIRGWQTLTEADAIVPAEGMQPADVEQLSRRSIRLARVEPQRRLRMDDIPQRLSELTYREVFTGADVDVADLVVLVHQKNARIGQVIGVQELATRITGSPDGDFPLPLQFRVVKSSNQRREQVRLGEIEVVIRSVQIRRHRRNEVRAVLLSIRLAELDPGDLCDRVR